MIRNIIDPQAKKLRSTKSTVFSPSEGASYSHHPFLAFFKGKFVAIWSNGRKNEDDIGQRVMIAESNDGEQWTNVRPIVTPQMLSRPQSVLTAAGFHEYEGRLYLFFGSYQYDQENCVNGMRPTSDSHHQDTEVCFVSTTDLVDWTAPKSMGIRLIPNHGPQKTASGRILLTGGFLFPYTDNPNGVDDYLLTGIYGDAFDGATPMDDSETIHTVTKRNGWNANLICEGSFFETDAGVLTMLLRSNSQRLWCAKSLDDGATWTPPTPTEFTNDDSKFHFGKLPDGRIYGVSNAHLGGDRCPLDLHLSCDGELFDRHYIIRDEPYEQQFEGLYKGGLYGYPHTLVHDGNLYVIYSKCKEAVEVTKFELDQL